MMYLRLTRRRSDGIGQLLRVSGPRADPNVGGEALSRILAGSISRLAREGNTIVGWLLPRGATLRAIALAGGHHLSAVAAGIRRQARAAVRAEGETGVDYLAA